ncbi:MAG: hypothetical protein V2A54_18300 [Bacteroidota bacterium]
MRIKITYLFATFIILSMLASCLSTDKVVSGGWLQKRKFNKGFYFARNGSNTKKKSLPEKEEKDSTVVSVPSKTICVHPALIIPDFSLLTEPMFRSEPAVKSKVKKGASKPTKKMGKGKPLSFALALNTGKSFHRLVPSNPSSGDIDPWAVICFFSGIFSIVFIVMQTMASGLIALVPLLVLLAIISFIVFFARNNSNHSAINNFFAIFGLICATLLLLIFFVVFAVLGA